MSLASPRQRTGTAGPLSPTTVHGTSGSGHPAKTSSARSGRHLRSASGTSFSSPIVAGTVSLILSAKQQTVNQSQAASALSHGRTLTPDLNQRAPRRLPSGFGLGERFRLNFRFRLLFLALLVAAMSNHQIPALTEATRSLGALDPLRIKQLKSRLPRSAILSSAPSTSSSILRTSTLVFTAHALRNGACASDRN